MKEQVVALHISDIHFGGDSVTFNDLKKNKSVFSKRLLGWINNGLFRKKGFSGDLRERLLEKVKSLEWDYLIISGDLTTFGMEQEFIEARKFVQPLLRKGEVILTSGNHDRYVQESLNPDLLAKYFYDCFPFKKNNLFKGLPYLEMGEEAVLIEIDMAAPKWLFSSRGKVKVSLKEWGSLLNKKFKNKIKIVVGHYPCFLPKDQKDTFLHSLSKAPRLQHFLIDNKIDLYLHGHVHKSWRFQPFLEEPLVCVNSGGCCRRSDGVWAGFHRITLKNKQVYVERISI